MRMKRLFSGLLACLLMAGLLSGCTQPSDNPPDTTNTSANPTSTPANTGAVTTSAADDPGVSPPGVLPLVSTPEVLTLGLAQAVTVMEYEDNYLTKKLEADTGVDIEFAFFPSDSAEAIRQLELLIASNTELPDVVLNIALSNTSRHAYGADGVFLPLRDLFEEYGYWTKQALEAIGEEGTELIWKYGTSPDGNVYGVPWYNMTYSDAVAYGLAVINKVWLDQLNLPVPATTDELYDTLVAFRDTDLNGNGTQDEIPMAGSKTNNESPIWFLLNSFTYTPTNYLIAEGGEVKVVYTKDEFRDGIAYIHRLVKDGLLYSGSFTQERAQLKAMTDLPTNEPTVVGTTFGYSTLIFSQTEENAKIMDYVNLPPLTGPAGERWNARGSNSYTYISYITRDCDNVPLAIRFLDYFNEPEVSNTIRYGELGVNWRYPEPGEEPKYPNTGDPVVTELVRVWGQENNVIWNMNPSRFFTGEWTGANTYVPGDNRVTNHMTDESIAGTVIRMADDMAPAERVYILVYTAEEEAEVTEIETSLKTYVSESISRFAVGDIDIEKDWDGYLRDLESIGLTRYLEIVNAAYKRMNN